MKPLEILNAATEKLRASEHYLEMRETMLGMPLAPYEKLFLDLLDPLCELFAYEEKKMSDSGEAWSVEYVSPVVEVAMAALDWETVSDKPELPEWIRESLDRITIRPAEGGNE